MFLEILVHKVERKKKEKKEGIQNCLQLGSRKLTPRPRPRPRLKLGHQNIPTSSFLSRTCPEQHYYTTMSSRTATTARLLQQSHRSSRHILRPIRTQSTLSFPTRRPTSPTAIATPILPSSSRLLPPPRNCQYSISTMNTTTNPIFAENANPEQLSAPLQSLLEKQWTLDDEGMGVAKTYYFKTYTKCLVRSYRSSFVVGWSGICD